MSSRMMHDYKFRDSGTPSRSRPAKRSPSLVRLLMLLLAIGVLVLIALSIRDLLGETETTARTESGLIALPLPPSADAEGQ